MRVCRRPVPEGRCGCVVKRPVVRDLAPSVQILETKTRKLEQLVRIKESKVQMLTQRLEEAGVS